MMVTEIESPALTVLDEHIASIQRGIDKLEAHIARCNGVGIKDDLFTVQLDKRDIRTLRIARRRIAEMLARQPT